ncbi:MAG TPA: hypothetical protein VMH91_04215 [Candidatus Paceibacterota bacterium]|nr:hypothetical protein [Candidatus Paceibacterota bacterium]
MARKPRFWKSLPPEDKKGIVKSLLGAGYTREAVGTALGTTKDAVVGYQHRKLPELTGQSEGTLDFVPEDVLRDLLTKVWPVESGTSSAATEQDLTSDEPGRVVTHKLANAWNQCKYSGGCGYERLPGMNNCGRPGHDK